MADGPSTGRETGTGQEAPRPPNADEFEARPEFERFKEVMRQLLAVPKSELDRKVGQAKKCSPRAGNPNAPGRKKQQA